MRFFGSERPLGEICISYRRIVYFGCKSYITFADYCDKDHSTTMNNERWLIKLRSMADQVTLDG